MNRPSMNQQIFKMGFSVETVSAYLLCCGIADNGETVSTKKLFERWNGTKESLMKSLEELEERNIIRKIISSDQDNNAIYQIADKWESGNHVKF